MGNNIYRRHPSYKKRLRCLKRIKHRKDIFILLCANEKESNRRGVWTKGWITKQEGNLSFTEFRNVDAGYATMHTKKFRAWKITSRFSLFFIHEKAVDVYPSQSNARRIPTIKYRSGGKEFRLCPEKDSRFYMHQSSIKNYVLPYTYVLKLKMDFSFWIWTVLPI